MFYITVCDDDPYFIKYIEQKLLESGLNSEGVAFSEYNSGEELIQSLAACERIDLIILDMQMKEMNGHKTAKEFRKHFPSSIIVFCSGVCLPTVESFETTPFRYLLKEYTDERMIKELKVIINELKSRKHEPVITGNMNNQTIKLTLNEILFISIAKRGSDIYIVPDEKRNKDWKRLHSKIKLSEHYLQLKDFGFEYVHNSYIVNMNHIVSMSRTELELSDGTMLTVARSKEKELRIAFAKWISYKY